MDKYSEKIQYSGNITISDDSKYLAYSRGQNLIIYECETLKQKQKLNFYDNIEYIQWSKNNKLILIGLFKRGICEVRSIDDDQNNWYCKIDEGIQGMNYALFSPDSNHILTITEFNIRLTVRSLVDKSTFFINLPKFSRRGLSFSENGERKFMALAERHNAQDMIGIYYLGNWTCLNKFQPQTVDLQDIFWSYDSSSLIVQDTPNIFKVLIYSIIGNLEKEIKIPEFGLGIKCILVSPNERKYTCLGLFNATIHLFNNISNTNISVFEHNKERLNLKEVKIFKEEKKENGIYKYKELTEQKENIFSSLDIGQSKNQYENGISKIAYSYENNYLASKNDNMPMVIFIWDLNKLELISILIQKNEIKFFDWIPRQNILFIATGSNKLNYFDLSEPENPKCKVREIKQEFSNNSFIFSPNGKIMIIKGTTDFIVAKTKNNVKKEVSSFENEDLNGSD